MKTSDEETPKIQNVVLTSKSEPHLYTHTSGQNKTNGICKYVHAE